MGDVSAELFSMVCSERDFALLDVARLRAHLHESLELYARAECVGPTREERARVDEMRKEICLCALGAPRLLVLQPDGTVRKGTLEDWKEHAMQLERSVENWKEIADLERGLRIRRGQR